MTVSEITWTTVTSLASGYLRLGRRVRFIPVHPGVVVRGAFQLSCQLIHSIFGKNSPPNRLIGRDCGVTDEFVVVMSWPSR